MTDGVLKQSEVIINNYTKNQFPGAGLAPPFQVAGASCLAGADSIRVGVALGSVVLTGTVAAADDTRDRSQHFDFAVLSDPLPGIRTN